MFSYSRIRKINAKNDKHYLFKKDVELKHNNTDENEGINEYGSDFLKCKSNPSKR